MLGCDFDEQQTSAFCSGAGKCCVEGGPGCKTSKGGLGINSAIGCIPTDDINETAAFFLKWGIGIAGGIALITIIYASMLIISASGDPKRVMAGKELLMAAIMGLILLIFGVFVLRMVGVDVLGIPGL